MIKKFLIKKRKEIILTLILIYVVSLLILKPYEWSFYTCTLVLVVCICIYRLWYRRQSIQD
jgi:bacteriorhodopsin